MTEQKKSKLPDLEELTGIVGKLFSDLKKSVGEIITDYKDKRKEDDVQTPDENSSNKNTSTKNQHTKTHSEHKDKE